ncbi:hypothetical protein ACJQWK_05116 [Exserohilum turcicum]|uniref:Uncharacterized protein n=1 Tax=Exserohilum turcicum (strain 28A) TaxID=671987 RepID=R0K1A2_EXST2|nr:uncharacterized protein SETTUDRAFT_34923 [Exserohilum turcica Et28A]EOA82182.1 hypothetical protein SETTUDRAFT_34923 [Exserohilum turcica Et28A]
MKVCYTLFVLGFANLSLASPAPPISENPSSVLFKRNFGNCNGCGKCNLSNTFIGNCHDAVNKFQSGYNYNSHQRFTVGECYADWYCNGAYPTKDGADIKNVFNVGIYQKAGCQACGEWWLEDGSNCHGTIQAKGC